jgi:2-polyprenyl-3-methyl-5-hydroxy-6-metoxy-1,4-benzoquinol methylase
MHNTPTTQEQIAFFDNWNASHRDASFEQIEPESRARGDKVLEFLGALPVTRPRILEVGCGTGWLTERLAAFGATTALDLSPRAIEIATRRGLDAEFIVGNVYDYDFPEGRFDVAVCLETISCVPDQALFVAKLARIVRRDGFLVMTAQNKFVYERRSDIPPPVSGNIRKWLSRRALKRLLRPRFRIIRMTTVLPKGDRGLLFRVLNSYKVNWLLDRFVSRSRIVRVKERLGLGHTRVVLAQKAE